MNDYVTLNTKVQAGKKSNIKSIQKSDIDDIKDIKIDTNKSKIERITKFLETVKNPYVFSIEGVKVKFEYINNGLGINECLENLIRNKNM